MTDLGGSDEHKVRQVPPWPPSPESPYNLSCWGCVCGWQSGTFRDVRGNPVAEAAEQLAVDHERFFNAAPVGGSDELRDEPIMDSVREAWIKYTASYQSPGAACEEFDRLFEAVVVRRVAEDRHNLFQQLRDAADFESGDESTCDPATLMFTVEEFDAFECAEAVDWVRITASEYSDLLRRVAEAKAEALEDLAKMWERTASLHAYAMDDGDWAEMKQQCAAVRAYSKFKYPPLAVGQEGKPDVFV